MRVLFVCTGNICRSPTAELLTTSFAAEGGRPGLTAHSAGTAPWSVTVWNRRPRRCCSSSAATRSR
ncbi:hypothetical protein [Rhodococcus sp. O3]|uniref:arsenate reductase/protein-tyrosine-phosphatase family protein n=1 Tax=Rhodococcus sp. O3 TaxID=3404919 RepID=UPI003B685908